jgi:hypothetical protein
MPSHWQKRRQVQAGETYSKKEQRGHITILTAATLPN